MERIDRRVPIKVIAQELSISETRINQHIRALKDIYGAGSLNQLVENFRASNETPLSHHEHRDLYALFEIADFVAPEAEDAISSLSGASRLSTAASMSGFHSSVSNLSAPKIVNGILDGATGLQRRVGAIATICFVLATSTFLAVEAAHTINTSLGAL